MTDSLSYVNKIAVYIDAAVQTMLTEMNGAAAALRRRLQTASFKFKHKVGGSGSQGTGWNDVALAVLLQNPTVSPDEIVNATIHGALVYGTYAEFAEFAEIISTLDSPVFDLGIGTLSLDSSRGCVEPIIATGEQISDVSQEASDTSPLERAILMGVTVLNPIVRE
ncbi:hypothetical protein HDU88_008513 [Geranomyces variabilis]|nr:hypothetical protein HDU88_008513 [Geranomyces variabilis]